MSWQNYHFVAVYLLVRVCQKVTIAEQQAVQIEAQNLPDLKRLVEIVNNLGYDLWTVQLKASRITLRTRSLLELNNLKRCAASNNLVVNATILVDDLEAMVKSVYRASRVKRQVRTDGLESFVGGDYMSYDDYLRWLQHLKVRFPANVRLHRIGRTWQQRSLIVIGVGMHQNNSRVQNVWIDAAIHGREWISPASILYFTWMLLDRFDHGDRHARRLLEKFSFFIMPFVNPDGYQISFLGRNTILRFWRKNLRHNFNTSDVKCIGVDLNRNFPFAWNFTKGGASNNPCSEVYNGPSAASEPEIRAITSFIRYQSKRSRFIAFFTFHSFGQYWFYPWGYTRRLSLSDEDDLHTVARLGANAMTTEQFDEWHVGQSSRLMYLSSGTSEDWAKAIAGIKYTYCIELPPGDEAVNGFVLPPSAIRPVGTIVYSGLQNVLEAIAY